MIVAHGKVWIWLVRRSEKSNYIHWLTYYTNIRINLVFLVPTIMFQFEVLFFQRCCTWSRVSIIDFENFISALVLAIHLYNAGGSTTTHFALYLIRMDVLFFSTQFLRVQNYSVSKQASDRRKYVTDRGIKRNRTLKAILLILKKNNDAKRIMNWNYRSTDMYAIFFFCYSLGSANKIGSMFARDEERRKCKVSWISTRKRSSR